MVEDFIQSSSIWWCQIHISYLSIKRNQKKIDTSFNARAKKNEIDKWKKVTDFKCNQGINEKDVIKRTMIKCEE